MLSLTGAVACTKAPPPPSIASDPAPAVAPTPAGSPTLAAVPVPAEADAGRGPHVNVVAASSDADTLSLIRTERLRAKAEGRVLVVYVGATWCEPCKRFKEELRQHRLDERLGRVTLLAFDADADQDRLASAGYKFRFIPYVALPGADGHPAESTEAKGKGSGAWRELLDELDAWQAPEGRAGTPR